MTKDALAGLVWLWQQFMLAGGLILIWFGGEAGRAVIAGASGGLARWFMTDRARIRDGVISCCTGALMAPYLGPAVLKLFETVVGDMGDGDEARGFSYFTAGLLGMSAAKIVVALVEAHARRLGGGHGDDA
ncbi:hypothetical protein [Haematobacter massiliensis]|uniref:hypothetical protein n=1 Tax=Haematobacter massiliensis TaxID=195105 RepID=UPI0023F56A5D|nr:hypothetical protein [Haematobacter massiliensis]